MTDDDAADVEWLLDAGAPISSPAVQASLGNTDAIVMRSPCPACDDPNGIVTETGGQDVVRCSACGAYCYSRPKSESGKPQRSVRSRPNLKPSTRAKVLAAHGHRCVFCGRVAGDVILHVDHLIPRQVAVDNGFDMTLINSVLNLAPGCEECNLGKGDDLDAASITLVYLLLVAKARSAS